MLKVYDKAQWHIDAGEPEDKVIERFKMLFKFLDSKGLLIQEGKEILELGIDSSVSIHERMLSDAGNSFLDKYYNKVLESGLSQYEDMLENAYNDYIKVVI